MGPHIAGAADKVVQSVGVPVMSTPDESPDGIFKVTSSVSVTRLPSAVRQSKVKMLAPFVQPKVVHVSEMDSWNLAGCDETAVTTLAS